MPENSFNLNPREIQAVDFYTSWERNRGVGGLHESMSSVVVPGVHEHVRGVQRMQIALLEPRALQELDSAHLYQIHPLMN
jgi:hypothetical protein